MFVHQIDICDAALTPNKHVKCKHGLEFLSVWSGHEDFIHDRRDEHKAR